MGRGRKPEDLTEQRFGRLVAIEYVGHDTGGRSQWLCLCDCGNEKVASARHLKYGEVSSCGCLQREQALENVCKAQDAQYIKHGHSGNDRIRHGKPSPTYNSWRNMRARCNNPKNQRYRWYGAKGIRVCERWDTFVNFLDDMGERPDGHTISRLNHEGDYEPSNCEWATANTH